MYGDFKIQERSRKHSTNADESKQLWPEPNSAKNYILKNSKKKQVYRNTECSGWKRIEKIHELLSELFVIIVNQLNIDIDSWILRVKRKYLHIDWINYLRQEI